MRSKWFGDNRDLVKWSVLIHLAKRFQSSVILQVCFLSRHEFPQISLDGELLPMPQEVVEHFRSIRSVERLSNDVKIKVFDLPLDDREAYLKGALDFVNKVSGQPRVVFLDPDTGLAPAKAGVTHVTELETRKFWAALASRDVLVLYQHQTNRNGALWVQPKREQFASAIGVGSEEVGIAKGESIARDVVFYYARKQT